MVVGFITIRAYKVLSLNSTNKTLTQIAIKRTLHVVGKPANTQHALFSNSATSENTHLKNYVSLFE